MTLSERLLWAELRKLGLNIRRQAPLGPYVADFVCHPAKLVIEIDGGIHGLAEVRARDAVREAWLKSEGFRVLRFDAEEVIGDRFTVAFRIGQELARSPFPLEGGRVGVGGEHAGMDHTNAVGAELSFSPGDQATPPSQPFPPRGGRA